MAIYSTWIFPLGTNLFWRGIGMRTVSAKKKAELVQKLLKGADIALVSRIEGIPVAELKKWCALVKVKLRSRMGPNKRNGDGNSVDG